MTPAAPPVLLLSGVGMAAAVELRTAPVLAEHFRVIAFHAGRPQGRHPAADVIAQLADEALGLVDAAAAERVHVYGLSFGGLVAQELALRHPDRVAALVLGATSAGGDLRVAPEADAREFLARRPEMPLEEGLWASVPYSYAVATRRHHARRIGEDMAARLKAPVDLDDHRVQRDAVAAHDAADRLGQIAAPTLVVHGEEDRLVPLANGVQLSDRIPGARLLALPEAAHMYPTDAPEADREVVRFLAGEPASRPRAKAPRSGRAAAA